MGERGGGMSLTKHEARFVINRLDLNHIDALAERVRREWDLGELVFEAALMPGDGTHYGLLFAVLAYEVPIFGAPGGGGMDGSAYTASGCPFDGTYAVVTYLQRAQTLTVNRRGFVHPSTLSHLDVSEGSQLALAVFLNAVTQAAPGWETNYAESLGD